jgi:hypothetical protein
MAQSETTAKARKRTQGIDPSIAGDIEPLLGDIDYKAAYGEDLARTLDIETWATGIDWEEPIARIRAEIESAVGREERLRATVREKILPLIGKNPKKVLPPEAGVYRATAEELRAIHDGLLFPGEAEAVDGTSVTYDSLPLGVTQIGIAVVSYGGASATFAQRIFRKEIAGKGMDGYEAALDVIKQRDGRHGVGQKDGLSELGRRGVMTYAERRILLEKASAKWRIGHGAPCPYELMTGSGSMTLLRESLSVLQTMICDFKRFVFVPSAPGERGLLTIGNALGPAEYAIFDTIEGRISPIVDGGHYGGDHKDAAKKFVRDCCPSVLYGLYRASESSPPYLFYAHREHVHIAARIAIADSILRRERGFPMLIDVADAACRSAFGAEGFMGLVHNAYSQASNPLRYFGERDTRR